MIYTNPYDLIIVGVYTNFELHYHCCYTNDIKKSFKVFYYYFSKWYWTVDSICWVTYSLVCFLNILCRKSTRSGFILDVCGSGYHWVGQGICLFYELLFMGAKPGKKSWVRKECVHMYMEYRPWDKCKAILSKNNMKSWLWTV